MRILVVEDEAKVAQLLARALREQSYAVDVASTGQDGRHQAASEQYDLLILDIMLPDVDGLSILQDVRRRNVQLPVLLLTARDGVEDRVKGLDHGADDYLVKPFALAELLARAQALLRRTPATTMSVLEIADLKLDRSRRKAIRAGKPVELSPKEFSLLEYLMHHSGMVLGKTMITEHVWDESFESFSNLVEVYINRLRRKIDDGHKTKLIHTVRGMGYVLEPREEPE